MVGSGLEVGCGNGSHRLNHTYETIEVMEAVEFWVGRGWRMIPLSVLSRCVTAVVLHAKHIPFFGICSFANQSDFLNPVDEPYSCALGRSSYFSHASSKPALLTHGSPVSSTESIASGTH